jgi:SAM-dependent methyltransferase
MCYAVACRYSRPIEEVAMSSSSLEVLPAAGIDVARMPGHWLLARLGKRVLRPGGVEMTRWLLDALAIGRDDQVVELAPGMGATARLTLQRHPARYVAVDRDEAAVAQVRRLLRSSTDEVRVGLADDTGLADAAASVLYGEAMLTMQSDESKRRIVREAFRCLRPGGRYGIHEMMLQPDDVGEETKRAIKRDLAQAIHVGARPLTRSEWVDLLTSEGFRIEAVRTGPMHLLETRRFVQDEGLGRTLAFVGNVLRDRRARQRVLEMRSVFRRYAEHLGAVGIVAVRP